MSSPAERFEPWRLYLLHSSPLDLVVTDGSGRLWRLGLRPDGWAARRPYRGPSAALAPVTDDPAKWVSARAAGWPAPDPAGP